MCLHLCVPENMLSVLVARHLTGPLFVRELSSGCSAESLQLHTIIQMRRCAEHCIQLDMSQCGTKRLQQSSMQSCVCYHLIIDALYM